MIETNLIPETLRKYPPATFLVRRADANYTFNNTNVTIRKDIRVMIPVMAIHRDPAIYGDPERFDPERFSEEELIKGRPMSFLAFGDGPRNCIGARFANHQTKVGLIKILQHFRVDVCNKTEIPYEVNPRSFLLAPKKGIYLQFSKI
ncbi:putative cytochrome P450 6a14 [Cotesia typhae]|uniref:putative cytochrome P450 6a14 n=1 Tax=Cotesia typhae TaxID=2053667 RepID=UPI003D693468